MKWHRKQQEEKPRTVGDFMSAVEACQTEEAAQKLIADETEYTLRQRPELVREEARAVVMENVGYVSGYFDRGTAARILGLFGARHPVFGAIEEWPKTPEEALELGRKMGARMKGVA